MGGKSAVALARNKNSWDSGDPLASVLPRDFAVVRLGERLVHPSLLFQNEAFLAEARAIGPDPFSLDWFLQAARLRHGRAAPWLNKLLEFKKHPSEKVLCLGPSLGSDALEYARNNSEPIIAVPGESWIRVIQRNFSLVGFKAHFMVHGPGSLPIESESIDIVYWNQLNDDSSHAAAMAREVLRVLRPGGKAIVLAPSATNGSAYLGDSGMGWSAAPSTRKMLAGLFSGSVNSSWHQRGLRRAEIPWLLRWLPVSLMQRLIGRCLVFKAFKPLPVISRNHSGWNPPSSSVLEPAIWNGKTG